MPSGLQALFGSAANLIRNDGTSVPVAYLSELKYVLLYFSAHWCPPCQRFTPKLVEFYKVLRNEHKDVDIVYLSSDKSEAEFNQYFAKMPWLALPFDERNIKTKLSGKFKVEGIPTLLLLNSDGVVISKDATQRVATPDTVEEALADFPWIPPTLTEVLQGAVITTKDGRTLSLADLQALDSFAMYFTAHWCGPCRAFTPHLMKVYANLKKASPKTEIIFISSDRDQAMYDEYYATMPWAALEFGSAVKGRLSNLCEVEGIPSLVTVDAKTMTIVNLNARGAAMGDVNGTQFPWVPQPLPVLLELTMDEQKVAALNENVCYFLSLPEDESLAKFKTIIDAFATAATDVDEFRKGQETSDLRVTFFNVDAGEGSELLHRVVTLTKAPIQGLRSKPHIIATRLGPGKFVEVLSEGLESPESVANFAKAFYSKASADE